MLLFCRSIMRCNIRELADAEDGQEGQSARKNLRGLWAAVQMAKKVGKGLG